MRLFQPYPDHDSQIQVSASTRVPCPYPVRFVRFRYKHHAAASGYDRLCDYIDAPTVRLPTWLYWAGETVLRPYCLLYARRGGSYEYSRYDCVMETAVIRDAVRSQKGIYHFVYAEKCFKRIARLALSPGVKLIGTVHHPMEHQSWMFSDMRHFRAFDRLITMDRGSVPFWESVTETANVNWIPHGIDTEYFHPRSQSQRPTNVHRIIFLGTHERDFKTLCAVVHKLSRMGQFQFDIISNDPEVRRLANSLPGIYQHERLSDVDYRCLLQESDLLLLPLKRSTVCNTVLEALACGVPVVTTQGGIQDYLNPSCSQVEAVGDVDGMCEGVHRLLAQGEAARMAARQTACRFSWTEIAKLHIEVYRELLADKVL